MRRTMLAVLLLTLGSAVPPGNALPEVVANDNRKPAGRLRDGDLTQQDVSAQAKSFAAVDAAELRRLFRWAVLSFFLEPTRVGRLLRDTPWSTLARQGGGVLRGMLGAHT